MNGRVLLQLPSFRMRRKKVGFRVDKRRIEHLNVA